ncbi:hypothetical protein IFU01_18405 [Oxalobacteraceae sp. CFBP 8763]|nr:hypothetical protein [Oxalobacteraceae sp. CFBP 8763]
MELADRKKSQLHWPALGRELVSRTVEPSRHPSFVMFFLVVIVGIVPTGFWIELYAYFNATNPSTKLLRASIVSVVPAFVAATTMQLIWGEDGKKSLRAFAVLGLAICMVTLIFCGGDALVPWAALMFGATSAVIAFWLWWIANANQREFQDALSLASFSDPLGGEVDNTELLDEGLDGFITQ